MHLHQDLPASSGQSLRRHDLLNFIATLYEGDLHAKPRREILPSTCSAPPTVGNATRTRRRRLTRPSVDGSNPASMTSWSYWPGLGVHRGDGQGWQALPDQGAAPHRPQPVSAVVGDPRPRRVRRPRGCAVRRRVPRCAGSADPGRRRSPPFHLHRPHQQLQVHVARQRVGCARGHRRDRPAPCDPSAVRRFGVGVSLGAIPGATPTSAARMRRSWLLWNDPLSTLMRSSTPVAPERRAPSASAQEWAAETTNDRRALRRRVTLLFGDYHGFP